jgi:citrate lyase subunit beta/citryl-CoA lyase
MPTAATAGRRGADVRSDCWVSFLPKKSGGLDLQVKSKVESMFGEAINDQCREVLTALGVKHCRLELIDAGALPWTLAARIETAVRRNAEFGMRNAEFKRGRGLANSTIGPTYLPPLASWSTYGTSRDRFRRSRLYLPGNEPRFFINAGLHKPDGIILDLEDAVAPTEKDAARVLVRNALRQVNFYGAERMVRINQRERGLEDLEWVVPHNIHVILIPKAESAEQVRAVDDKIQTMVNPKSKLRTPHSEIQIPNSALHIPHSAIYLMPIIESALGGIKAYEIATASPNIVALALGLEDYTADIGVQRTLEGRESFWLRSQVVNAARAAGVQPIDTVFSDVADMEGLRVSALESKSIGFEGRGCIHPRQIRIIHEAFAPDPKEVDRAKNIVLAYEKAQAEGLGVISLGSKMIDPPVVKSALKTVQMAEALGMLHADWRRRE